MSDGKQIVETTETVVGVGRPDPYPEIKIVPILSTDGDYDEWLALFANRNEVAEDYARALSRYGPVWEGYAPVNQAILRRWSMSGLKYIKERAWKIATQNL